MIPLMYPLTAALHAFVYDGKVWFGIVEEKSKCFVKFMPSSRSKHLFFPKRDYTCWVHENDIHFTIDPPTLTSGRGYSI